MQIERTPTITKAPSSHTQHSNDAKRTLIPVVMMMNHPFTPIRRLFLRFDGFHAKTLLGKRSRPYQQQQQHQTQTQPQAKPEICLSNSFTRVEYADIDLSPTKTITITNDANHHPTPSTARLALQQEDEAIEAVIISTLPSYPFCCHEDLLTMSRTQLVQVAHKLNGRLPGVHQIPCGHDAAAAQIRHAIEVLVGIVPGTAPGAPKVVRAREPMMIIDAATADLRGLPSSPTRRLSISRRKLKKEVALEEEEEEEEIDLFKLLEGPIKRRRL